MSILKVYQNFESRIAEYVCKLTYLYCGIILVFALIVISGCQTLSLKDPRDHADRIAAESEFTKIWIEDPQLSFLTYQKIKQKGKPLHIYIEGDGRSYLSASKVSPDPTPHNPLALKLAVLDPHPNVVYLARPCQYMRTEKPGICHPDLWTKLRYTETPVNAMNHAVSVLKNQAKTQQLHLIGFSGGAAMAALISARRSDVLSLKTVAGDLDYESMTQHHQTTALPSDSLNPMQHLKVLSKLPQHHFIGAKDSVVPLFISEKFVQALHQQSPAHIAQIQRTVIEDASHHEGWEKLWPELLKK